MAFRLFLERKRTLGDTVIAWDDEGRAWQLNRQHVIDIKGDVYKANPLDDPFLCESCKLHFEWPGDICEGCGAQIPPAWVRAKHLDHPLASL